MYCPNCGKELPKGAAFCGFCGTSIPEADENVTDRAGSDTGGKWKIAVFIICSISIVFFLMAGALLLLQGDGDGESASDNPVENGEETEEEYLEEDLSVSVVPATQAVLMEHKKEIEVLAENYYRIYEDKVADYSASSEIQQDNGVINPPIYAMDGDEQTNWQEGVDGPGIGEFVSYRFDREYKIQALTLKLGNWKDEQYYYGNNRPSSLILTLGEESWTVDFPDEWEEFGVRFTSSVQTDTLKVAINGVYEGTEWDDTVIAEIGVWYE